VREPPVAYHRFSDGARMTAERMVKLIGRGSSMFFMPRNYSYAMESLLRGLCTDIIVCAVDQSVANPRDRDHVA
jgi:hypothetical protein